MTEDERRSLPPQVFNVEYVETMRSIQRTREYLEAIASGAEGNQVVINPRLIFPSELNKASFFLVLSNEPIAYASDPNAKGINYFYRALQADIETGYRVILTVTVSFTPKKNSPLSTLQAGIGYDLRHYSLEDIAKVRVESRTAHEKPEEREKLFDFTCTYKPLFSSEQTGITVAYPVEDRANDRVTSFYYCLPGRDYSQISPERESAFVQGMRDCSSILAAELP